MNDRLVEEREAIKEVTFSEEETIAKFDSASRFYYWIMGIFEIKPNRMAIEMASIKEGEMVLEVGFGTGWCLQRLVPCVGANNPVYGLDFSAGMKEEALRNLRNKGMEKSVRLYTGNVKHMPFEDNKFDVVFATFLLDLMKCEDIPRALFEMKRVLKPEGRLIVVSLTKEGRGIFRVARWAFERMYLKWPTIFGYKSSSRPIYIGNAIIKAGFDILKSRLTYITGFLVPVALISAKQKNVPKIQETECRSQETGDRIQ